MNLNIISYTSSIGVLIFGAFAYGIGIGFLAGLMTLYTFQIIKTFIEMIEAMKEQKKVF